MRELESSRAHPRDIKAKRQAGPRLNLVAQVFTGLKQVRGMALGPANSQGDAFLIAGANVDGGVVMYKRVDGGRNLSEVARNVDIANRTSFVFF